MKSSMSWVVTVILSGCVGGATGDGSNHDHSSKPTNSSPNPTGAPQSCAERTTTDSLKLGSVQQRDSPPPLTGGTLLVAHDGKTAVAADPERDQVSIVDVYAQLLLGRVALQPGDEPGRLVEDGARRVHVALRQGGAIADIDLATRSLIARRKVCAAPRGIAYDTAKDVLHVACAGGELVTLPAAGGAPTRTLQLDSDLRDVLVRGDQLFVTRFRSAQLLTIDSNGQVSARTSPSELRDPSVRNGQRFAPAVAWRTIARSDGSLLMLHQRGLEDVIVAQDSTGLGESPPGAGASYYGGADCANSPVVQ
jgi:hypothetical protein